MSTKNMKSTECDGKTSYEDFLKESLFKEALCSSKDEVLAIIDAIKSDAEEANITLLESIVDENQIDRQCESFVSKSLQYQIGLSEKVALTVVQDCRRRLKQRIAELSNDTDSSSDDSANNEDSSKSDDMSDPDSDDEGAFLGSGACELCEREDVKLTRHHMIPKSTYKSIEPKLIRLVLWHIDNRDESDSNYNAEHQSNDTTNESFGHLIPVTIETIKSMKHCKGNLKLKFKSKEYIKIVQKAVRCILKLQTIDICRPCHSMLHKSYDNITLAISYNTIDKLLQDEKILKFSKWHFKQKRVK